MEMREMTVTAATDKLKAVLEMVEEELAARGCPDRVRTQIGIAVEEIFVNIAHYAYAPELGKATVSLTVDGDPETAVIRFTDRGRAYDPLKEEDPDVSLPAGERDIGGLGVFMVKKTMDRVEYRREGGKNILTIQKRLL